MVSDNEFERLGAAQVRANIVTKVYLGADEALARAWLERRNEASCAEQLEIARSAKDAAWAAARAAQTANSKATMAIVIAIISVVITIVLGVIPFVSKR